MGEAKRRKLLDANYGKQPEWSILNPSDECYSTAQNLIETVYPDKQIVYPVKITYSLKEAYIGAVYMFLQGKKICGECVWVSEDEIEKPRSGKELQNVVLKPLAQKLKDEMSASDVVLIHS